MIGSLSLAGLVPVSNEAAMAYSFVQPRLVDDVNAALAAHPALAELLGGNPIRLLYDNHRNHAAFMATVFRYGNFGLLATILPWVYRAYHSQGVSWEYFQFALNAWKRAVSKALEPEMAEQINTVYDWMIAAHEILISLAASPLVPTGEIPERMRDVAMGFLGALKSGDHRTAMRIAEGFERDSRSLTDFYVHVVQPAMYEIGNLWEKGELSVAREHLASSIVARVMASQYARADFVPAARGSAIVSAAPNEFHQVGAWMVANCLEQDGWNVRYLGANTPEESVVDMVRETRPSFVALSVSMPYNLERTQKLIADIRSADGVADTKIMVGGLLFHYMPEMAVFIGADGHATDCRGAVEMASSWAAAG